MYDEWVPHQEETDERPIHMVVVVKVDACDQIRDYVTTREKGVENPEKKQFYHSDDFPKKDSIEGLPLSFWDILCLTFSAWKH